MPAANSAKHAGISDGHPIGVGIAIGIGFRAGGVDTDSDSDTDTDVCGLERTNKKDPEDVGIPRV